MATAFSFPDSFYANDPAKLDECNRWINAARPIIKAYLVLDDQAQGPLVEGAAAERTGKRWNEPATWRERDYREAQDIIKKAARELYDMLDGMRDSSISDERLGLYDNDDEQEEADAFNDWLVENTVSVDAAIDRVADEVRA